MVLGDSNGQLLVRKYADLKIFNNSVQVGKISAPRFDISSQWFPKGQPEKVLCFIIGYNETLISNNLFKMR